MWYRIVLSVFIIACTCTRLLADTLHVYFPLDVAFLDEGIEKQIGKHLAEIKAEKQVMVIGYASRDGDTYYNDMLSMRRAQNVADYLTAKGIKKEDIKLVYGRGEVVRNKEEQHLYRYDRRVDIVGGNEPPTPAEKPKSITEPTKPTETVSEKLDTVEVGGTLALNNIQFVPGMAIPLQSSESTLIELYEAMNEKPGLKIRIEGHICCEDEPQGDTRGHGYILSIERARTVYFYLKRRGIAPERMTCKGFSSWHRLASEATEEGKSKNRRVEIRVMNK